jgi:hypothetical protein
MYSDHIQPPVPDPAADVMNYGAVVFVAVIVLSLIYYWFPKYGARHHFTGPAHTLSTAITPELVAAVQHEYEVKDQERRLSHVHHGVFHHEKRPSAVENTE